MNYHVVFDATKDSVDWVYPLIGLIFVIIGFVAVRYRADLARMWGASPGFAQVFPVIFLGVVLCWATIWQGSMYSRREKLLLANEHEMVRDVEGVVTDFRPMPYAGHAMERFCVHKTCFEYSDYVDNGGFNNTSSHGGPIRQGLRVRVRYVDEVILRLEVAS